MNTLTKTIMCLQMAALFLTAALAGPAKSAVPFKGSLQQVEIDEGQFPILSVVASATGNATHLGRYTMSSEFEINLLTLEGSGFADIISADGDTLSAGFVGNATPTSTSGFLQIVETYTITGGTGRFAGATGSFTVERLFNTTAGVSTGSFQGTILLTHGK